MFGVIIAFKDLNFTKGILKSDWVGLSILNICLKHRMHSGLHEIRWDITVHLLWSI